MQLLLIHQVLYPLSAKCPMCFGLGRSERDFEATLNVWLIFREVPHEMNRFELLLIFQCPQGLGIHFSVCLS